MLFIIGYGSCSKSTQEFNIVGSWTFDQVQANVGGLYTPVPKSMYIERVPESWLEVSYTFYENRTGLVVHAGQETAITWTEISPNHYFSEGGDEEVYLSVAGEGMYTEVEEPTTGIMLRVFFKKVLE